MHRKKPPDTTTPEPILLSRRSFMKKMGLASLGCVLVGNPWNLPAWNIVRGNGTRLGTMQESKTMKLAQQSSSADRTIPPIDVAAPAATETATFAMG